MNEESGPVPSEPDEKRLVSDFVERWRAAWNSREPDRILSLCTADVAWDDPVFAQPLQGREEVRTYLGSLFAAFPDLELVLAEPFESVAGDRLAVFWDREGTMLGRMAPIGFHPTRQRVAFDGLDLLDFRNGLVSAVRSRPDARVIQQIGLLPFAGSRAERLAVAVQRLQARRIGRRST